MASDAAPVTPEPSKRPTTIMVQPAESTGSTPHSRHEKANNFDGPWKKPDRKVRRYPRSDPSFSRSSKLFGSLAHARFSLPCRLQCDAARRLCLWRDAEVSVERVSRSISVKWAWAWSSVSPALRRPDVAGLSHNAGTSVVLIQPLHGVLCWTPDFRTLCWLAIAFGFMTVLALPAMLLSLEGKRYTPEEQDPMGLVKFTIGNNGFPPPPNSSAPVVETKTILFGNELASEEVTYIISFFDFCSAMFFLLFIFFYKFRITALIDEVDEGVISPQDFGVFVTGLPKDAQKTEILDHFDKLYALDKPDFEHKGACGCLRIGGKKLRPPAPTWDGSVLKPNADVGNSGDPMYMGKWVCEVNIARKDGAVIRKFLAQKKLLKKLAAAKAMVQKYEPQSTETANPTKLASAKKKLEKLDAKLNAVVSKNVKPDDSQCLGAFVTFCYEEQQIRALHDYRHPPKGCCTYRKCSAKELKFRGTHDLKVEISDDPSNIVWENIETTPRAAFLRRSLTNFVVFVLLVVSLALLYQAQQAKKAFQSALPPSDVCDLQIFAAAYGTVDETRWGDPYIARGTAEQDEACGDGNFYLTVAERGTGDPVTWAGDETSWPDDMDVCTDTCVGLTDNSKCDYVDGSGDVYKQTDVLSCACLGILVDLINEHGVITGGQKARDDHSDMCSQVAQDFIASNSLLIGAALAVVVINFVLKLVLKKLVAFERHATVSGQQTAVALKIFLAQVLNTGVIVLIVNASLPGNAEFPVTGVLQGEHRGFTAAWYSSVGVSILITMLVNMFVPHGGPLAKFLVIGPCKRACLSRLASNQPGLDAAYAPERFDIGGERYPFVLNTVFVTMAYYSGLPLLLPMASIGFIIFFWVDKILILRSYQRPARIDEAMAMLTARLLPLAVLIHVALSMWMLGESDVLKSGTINAGAFDAEGDSPEQAYEEWKAGVEQWDYIGFFPIVVRSNVFPLFLTLLGLLFFQLFLRHVLGGLGSCALGCFHACTCGKFASMESALKDADERRLFAAGVGYTDEFKVLVPVHGLKVKKKKGAVVPIDEEADCQFREKLANKHLSREDKAHGWDLVKEYNDMNDKKLEKCFKVKRWQEDGEFHGVPYQTGDIKKTYQVIAETGIHSYDIMDNPTYKQAMHAFAQGKLKARSTGGTPKVRADIEAAAEAK